MFSNFENHSLNETKVNLVSEVQFVPLLEVAKTGVEVATSQIPSAS